MTAYEDDTAISEQLETLKNRIGCLMLVMVDGLSGKDEALISPDVARDIERLGSSLQAVQKDLDRITAQRTWILIAFRSANKEIINACLNRLTDALQCFYVAQFIHDGNMLLEIQTRLDSLSRDTGEIAKKVDSSYDWLLDKDAHKAQSNLGLEDMPVITRLYGRDGVIEQIVNLLTTKSRPRIGILGAGGMGKTSVAVAVMENEIVGKMYRESHRFWVPCVGVTSPTTFLQTISKSLRVNQDTGAPPKDILHALKSTKEPRLILIDNMESVLSIPEVATDGTNQKHLKWWAKSVDDISAAISTLNDTALVTQGREGVSSPKYFVLPVVQSYLHDNPRYNTPTMRRLVIEACCRFILDHKSSPGDEKFKAHLKELDIERTNIQAILSSITQELLAELSLTQNSYDVFEAMLTFGWFQFWTKINTDLMQHLLQFASSANVGEQRTLRYIAEAHFCLGKHYTYLGRCSEACTSLEAARANFQDLGTPADILRAGEAALGLVEAYIFMTKPIEDVKSLLLQAQADLQGDPRGSACALMFGGYAHWYSESPQSGLSDLKHAKESLEVLGNTADIARCILYMMRCYADLGLLSDWMEAGQEGLRLSKRVGIDDMTWEALDGLSRCYVRMEKYDDALSTLKESLVVAQQVGAPLAIAQTIELSGYAYGMKGDLYGSRLGYEQAKKIYYEIEKTNQTRENIDDCIYNLQQIEDAGGWDVWLRAPFLS
ncbi:hypothetical protein FRC17_005335 [Serendipita sp. 399]|nr:hypothetical protein FRC17_005335 [Serendipita sp. 399]